MISAVYLGIFMSGVLGASLKRDSGISACQHYCPSNYYPVCGTNGVTYSNGCLLSEAGCVQSGYGLSIRHYGPCLMAEMTAANHSCFHPICDEDSHFVCASDGNVYKNDCFYHTAACEAARNGTHMFIVLHADYCPTPRTPDCSKYHVNTTDIALEHGTHVTEHRCSFNGPRVCTSDGRSYTNECTLCRHLDSSNSVQILHDGPCHGVHTVPIG